MLPGDGRGIRVGGPVTTVLALNRDAEIGYQWARHTDRALEASVAEVPGTFDA